jgi:Neutral/alkaline non-lysosomal ceramidase, N-terminal
MLAGFGKVELPVPDGVELVGYPNRDGGAAGTHEPLHARALVLEAGRERVALCSVDLCWVTEDVVAAARERLAALSAIPREALFVSATHTHSGPGDGDSACFPDGLDALIEAAVAQACARLEPASVGAGWGMLHGHALNRRRLEDPVDPAVFAIRVDGEDGRALGIYYGFACHPVVMGPDSRLVSGDWPAIASRLLEAELGDGSVAVFGQGACADVNPLTANVLARLAEGRLVDSTAQRLYYGPDQPVFAVGDRIGGTREETARIGEAVAREALRVHRGIALDDVERLWIQQLRLDPVSKAPPSGTPIPGHMANSWEHASLFERTDPLEVMLVGIDGPGIVLVGQPGEVFGDTGVDLRRALRNHGVAHPFVVGYANGFRLYLPPRHAFPDRGYEVEWAWALNISETLQDDIRARVIDAVRLHAPPER